VDASRIGGGGANRRKQPVVLGTKLHRSYRGRTAQNRH